MKKLLRKAFPFRRRVDSKKSTSWSKNFEHSLAEGYGLNLYDSIGTGDTI